MDFQRNPEHNRSRSNDPIPGFADPAIASSGAHFIVSPEAHHPARLLIDGISYLAHFSDPQVVLKAFGEIEQGAVVIPLYDPAVQTDAKKSVIAYVEWQPLYESKFHLLPAGRISTEELIPLKTLVENHGAASGINGHIGTYDQPCGDTPTKISLSKDGELRNYLYTKDLIAAHLIQGLADEQAQALSSLNADGKALHSKGWLYSNLVDVKRALDLAVTLYEEQATHEAADSLSWSVSLANPDVNPGLASLVGDRHNIEHQFDPKNHVTAYDHSDQEILSALQRYGRYRGQLALRGLVAASFTITEVEGSYCLDTSSLHMKPEDAVEVAEALGAKPGISHARLLYSPHVEQGDTLTTVSPTAILKTLCATESLFDAVLAPPQTYRGSSVQAWMPVLKDNQVFRIQISLSHAPDQYDPGLDLSYYVTDPSRASADRNRKGGVAPAVLIDILPGWSETPVFPLRQLESAIALQEAIAERCPTLLP